MLVASVDLLKANAKFVWSPVCQQAFFRMSRPCCAVLQCWLLLVCSGHSSCRWTPVTWGQVLYCCIRTVRRRGLSVSFPENLTNINLTTLLLKSKFLLWWGLCAFLMYMWVQECHWWYLMITTHLHFWIPWNAPIKDWLGGLWDHHTERSFAPDAPRSSPYFFFLFFLDHPILHTPFFTHAYMLPLTDFHTSQYCWFVELILVKNK